MSSVPSVSPVPFRRLEQGEITPREYANQVRREVRELVRESSVPRHSATPDKRRVSDGDGSS
jgi:hypothetical protein